jgi:hypothetical protein
MALPRAQTADTLQAVVNTDVLTLTIERVTGGAKCFAFYQVRLSGGSVHSKRQMEIPLSAQALTDLNTFLTNRVVPTINSNDA